jgi:hypothetical protein
MSGMTQGEWKESSPPNAAMKTPNATDCRRQRLTIACTLAGNLFGLAVVNLRSCEIVLCQNRRVVPLTVVGMVTR